MTIECLVLGAGQEVGKSCVVVTLGGKKIMFDCGMHMGSVNDPYPDFSRVSPTGDFDAVLDCIVITHFHLDHVGALPYFTEVCGYNGPIYMTYPTKALAPLMLEDYRKVMVDRRGEKERFTSDHITSCMNKVTAVDIKQTVQVKELLLRAYYAGHVLGAAMFYARVGDSAMVYTGDYNMTPDRHLGAAQIDCLQLDLLVTESTYATTIRGSKYAREREFLKVVHKCVAGGGKVLLPTFAMGRAQELCLLLDDYWERMNWKIPIYFSAGLTVQANMYYKMLVSWTSQKIKDNHGKHNAFDFNHVRPFNRSLIDAPGPCVLFATPGMLTGGFSLEVFKHWAPSERNLVTLPGYCLAGTLGHKLMSGNVSRDDLYKDTQIDVRCQIHQLSFSPHTDAKGIMDLLGYLLPKHVVLVHGERPSMEKLKGRIQTELGIPCYSPANNENLTLPTSQIVNIHASKMFVNNCSGAFFNGSSNRVDILNHGDEVVETSQRNYIRDEKVGEGILVMDKTRRPKVVHETELSQLIGIEEQKVYFCYCCSVDTKSLEKESNDMFFPFNNSGWLHALRIKIETLADVKGIMEAPDKLRLGSLLIRHCLEKSCPYRCTTTNGDTGDHLVYFCFTWSAADEEIAQKILLFLRNLNLEDERIRESPKHLPFVDFPSDSLGSETCDQTS